MGSGFQYRETPKPIEGRQRLETRGGRLERNCGVPSLASSEADTVPGQPAPIVRRGAAGAGIPSEPRCLRHRVAGRMGIRVRAQERDPIWPIVAERIQKRASVYIMQ